jgi:anti-sigma factor RsiW
MTCDEARELIGPYQDGELASERRAEVSAHLDACAPCAALLKRNLDLSRSIRDLAPSYQAPAQLLDRNGTGGSRPGLGFWGGLSLGLAAVAVAMVLLLPRRNPDLAASLVADHVRSLMATHLIDVPSSDRHTVKPWFLGKVDFAPTIPDLSLQGFPLLGGRLEYVSGKPAAALVYRKAKHIINVFVLKGEEPPKPEDLDGYHVVSWQEGGLEYSAVSDAAPGDLQTFSAEFQSAK